MPKMAATEMQLQILSAGPLTTIQDLGRFGFERFGVPQSGAMDWFALRAANALVGNLPGAAGLEFLLDGPRIKVHGDCLVAAAGCGYELFIQGRRVGMWRCALARKNETIEVVAMETSGWGYLAVCGGIDVPEVMGARSTYLRGGFGGVEGRALRNGDCIQSSGKLPPNWPRMAGRRLHPKYLPAYSNTVEIPVVTGPQSSVFGDGGLSEFLSGVYTIRSSSDRMGYRLDGPCISRVDNTELVSEGIAAGSIQVPPDGQPIVLLSDRPTTGGYAKIATVCTAGLPLLAQAMPGIGQVHFRAVSVEQAQFDYRAMLAGINQGVLAYED